MDAASGNLAGFHPHDCQRCNHKSERRPIDVPADPWSHLLRGGYCCVDNCWLCVESDPVRYHRHHFSQARPLTKPSCVPRTLKRYSWLASSAIWINILVILLSVGFIAHSPPNYAAAKAAYKIPEGPVITQAFATYPFYSRINGVMNIVYAYGGATIVRRNLTYIS